jgi:hypothetical protein
MLYNKASFETAEQQWDRAKLSAENETKNLNLESLIFQLLWKS